MQIVGAEIFEVDLPFRLKFGHASKVRQTSESVFIKLWSDTGDQGWGESLPRDYVTGETRAQVVAYLQQAFLPVLIQEPVSAWDAALALAETLEARAREKCPELPDRIGASCCAAELALLDLAGKHFRRSVAEIFGPRKREWIEYSGVIGSGSPLKNAKSALKMRLGGLKQIKVKVGQPDDLKRLAWIRRCAGRGTDIRVDANAAWDVSNTISMVQSMRQFEVSCVEQPLPREDLAGLQSVTAALTTPIMVDESLCSFTDARDLVARDACDFFNVRISKCGGLYGAMRVAEYGRNHDKGIQLGCQVGESALLSAAGRHFALGIAGLRYYEGSYGRHLLEKDIADKDLTFGRKGLGRPLSDPGLGVTVIEDKLAPHITARYTLGDTT